MLDAVGAVAATSANDPGGPAAGGSTRCPSGSGPARGRARRGPPAGHSSTVLDFSGPEPVVLREGGASVGRRFRPQSPARYSA